MYVSGLIVKFNMATENSFFLILLEMLLRHFRNSNGRLTRSIVEISKKYRFENSTSGLVVKIQNDRRKPGFRQ